MSGRREYSKPERLDRACLRVAMVIRGLWEEQGHSHSRLLEGILLPDELTQVGKSRDCSGPGYREHVVPLAMIVHRCHDMLKVDGATDRDLAELIKANVRIVEISLEERNRLDQKDQLNMRSSMPEGWKFGDNVYARLELAGIIWDPIEA